MIRTITSLDDLVKAFGELKTVDLTKPHTLTFKEGKPRRRDLLNRLQHHWLAELAEQTGYGKEYWRGYCKWEFGCPILARDDEWFQANIHDQFMCTYTYEEIIDIMGTNVISVTSEMSDKQMSEYLTDVRNHANSQGYRLTDKNDMFFEALYGAK